jgi:EmrB/QacA subfamily drug resistance transporter
VKPRPRAALALLSVAQFVDVLSITIAIVALPSIQRDLSFPQRDLQWVVSIYALLFGGFLMISGRAADLYGRRRMFMAGLALFASASLACGLASTPGSLVVARAAQGLGAALVVPAALSILTVTFSEGAARNRALGVWTAAAAGGGATGFFVGGVITGALGWRWVFLVNVPVAAVSCALAPLLLTESRDPKASRRLDMAGATTVTAGLLVLIYGFTRPQGAGVASPVTWGSLLLALMLLVSFGLIERRAEHPMVPLRLFHSRTLMGASLVAFVLTAVTSPSSVLGTLYLQQVLGYSPSAAGIAFVPFSLSVIVASFAGSWLIGRIGPRATMFWGLIAVSAAIVIFSGISVDGGLGYVVVGAALSGCGLGCAAVASTAAGTSAASSHDQGLVSGLLNTAAQVGHALGIAVLVTIAAARTDALAVGGEPTAAELVSGFRLAFYVGATIAIGGALAAFLAVNERSPQSSESKRFQGKDEAPPAVRAPIN